MQYILAGWQTGTVYKKVSLEANAAAAAAIALLHGKKPESNGFRKNGSKKEPTLTLPVTWITKKNYTDALQAALAEEERSVHRSVQEVLQLARSL